MRTIPSSMATHLGSGATTLCNCWKITRRDGEVQGFTDHDEAVTFDGQTYEARSGFIGTESLSRIGLSVDNMEVHSALSSGTLEERDLRNGIYDNADVEIYLVNWQSPEDQNVITKAGNIGEVRRGGLTFMAEIRGKAHILQQTQGRSFQATCDAELGDDKCGVDLTGASFMATATVAAIDPDQLITSTSLPTFETNWFRGGKLEWLTGPNAGAIGQVKSQQRQVDLSTLITLWHKFSAAPEIGDQFKITAGCDKRFQTCKQKFANQINFRGFPHIPGNNFLISTPGQNDGTQDGSSQNE